MHGQQGDQVGEFLAVLVEVGAAGAGVGEQAGQAAGRVGGQVQQVEGGFQLGFGEPAVVGGGDQVGFGEFGAEVLAFDGRGEQQVDQVADPDRDGGAQSGAAGEERVGGPGGVREREGEDRCEELTVQVDAGAGGGCGERLPVLFGAEQRAGFQQSGLQLGVAADAVLDDVDEFGGAPLVLGVDALVAGLADVGEDGVLVPVPVGDVVERLVDQVGDGLHPVDRADVAAGRLQGAAQRLRVLDGAVAGLFGGELGVGEAAAADQHLQLDLGGDLSARHIGVQRADQDVDRLVGGAQVHPAVLAGDFLDQFEVVVAAGVFAVRAEGAVDGAEAAVHAADVDQRLQHPAGHPLVLGGGPPGVLGGDPGLQPAQHYVAVGPGVEVHVQGDQVDGGEADLGHRVGGVLAGQVDLAAVQVVQRRGARQRLEPTGESLVGGRSGGGPGGLVCDGGHGGQD